jgi:hypothetical protein
MNDTTKLSDLVDQIRHGAYGDISSLIIYKRDSVVSEEY